MRKLFLWVGLFSLVASGAQAASYQMIDGTIVDPIQFTYGGDSDYPGIDLEPYANLTDANLKFSDLPYADLSFATLIDTFLIETNLTNANLIGAHLNNANLAEAILTNANLGNATYNAYTVFPSGFDPVSEGMLLVP